MMVKTRMTPNPITATPDMGVLDALKLMRKHNVRRLPVLEDDKLIGIVVESELLRVAPSPATTLSVFEMNTILIKMPVREVMTPDPVTVTPDTLIEEAAVLMRENVVSGLPVLDDGKLVGIITETNIFDAFVDSMGLNNGIRLSLETETNPVCWARTRIIGIMASALLVWPRSMKGNKTLHRLASGYSGQRCCHTGSESRMW